MEKLLHTLRSLLKNPAGLSLALTMTLFAPVILLCGQRYETNDDFFMNSIVSGFFLGEPDEHLPYTHFLIGHVLSSAYAWSAAVNWYALYLNVTHILSWLAIFHAFARRPLPVIHLSIATGLFLALEPIFYTHLQFTTTAILAAMAGMTLLHGALEAERINRRQLAVGVVMVLYGAMIRESSAYLAVIFGSAALFRFDGLKGLVKPVLTAGILFMLINGLQQANRLYHEKDPEWAAYYHEIKSGNRFNDNPAFYKDVVNAGKDLRKINGWTSNDLMLFAAFFRNYEPLYNLKAYDQLHGQYTRFTPLPFRDYLYRFRNAFGIFFLIVLLLFLLAFNDRAGRMNVLLQCLLLAGLAWYIYGALQLKERALLSMAFAFSAGLLLTGTKVDAASARDRRISSSMVVLFIAGCLFFQYTRLKPVRARMAADRSISLELLGKMKKEDVTWLVWGPALPLEGLNPLKFNFSHAGRSPLIYPISAFNKHPLALKAYGRPIEKLIALGNSRILSMQENWVTFTPERLDTFYRSHLGCSLLAGGDSVDAVTGRRIFWFRGCLPGQAP